MLGAEPGIKTVLAPAEDASSPVGVGSLSAHAANANGIANGIATSSAAAGTVRSAFKTNMAP